MATGFCLRGGMLPAKILTVYAMNETTPAIDLPPWLRDQGVVLQWAEPWMWTTPVMPEEERVFKGSSEKRRAEFRAGRHCARRVLQALGMEEEHAIVRGPEGEPVWPVRVSGSISHTAGACLAVGVQQKNMVAIGVDVEKNQPLKPGVFERIATPAEQVKLGLLATSVDSVCLDTVLFSIKEAVYKAYFPVARQWLGFMDVDVELDAAAQRFVCRIITTDRQHVACMDGIAGYYGLSADHIMALAFITTR